MKFFNLQYSLIPLTIAATVLAVCLAYTLGHVYIVPYPGFGYDGRWRIIEQDTCANDKQISDPTGWCTETAGLLQPGDQIEFIQLPNGNERLARLDYLKSLLIVPFEGLGEGERVFLSITRNGEQTDVLWPIRGATLQEQLGRLTGSIFFLPFWLAGTAALLFFRPRDRRWLLLISLNYLTALWFVVGAVSVTRIFLSTPFLVLLSWLMAPVYLHFHLLMPYPLLTHKFQRRYGWMYVVAILIAALSLLDIIPFSIYSLGLVIGMGGSIILLLMRLLRPQAAARPAVYLMLTGIVVAILPGLLWLIPVIGGNEGGTSATVTTLVTLALPALPFFYTYALYKHRLGGQEVRANRALAVYSFAVLYATVFVVLFVLFHRRPEMDAGALSAALMASASSLLLALLAWNPFKRFLNRITYGTVYEPEQLVRQFANEIPRALNRKQLTQLLRHQIMPSLLIRQSALFWLADTEPSLIYGDQIPAEAVAMPSAQFIALMSAQGRFLTSDEAPSAPLNWVKLVIPIQIDQQQLGAWLLGRRDPDDFYPQTDIDLLATLGNQIAVALETIRLFEIADRRASELERVNFELRRADRLKSDLLRNVTHELKTPLTVIQGFSELLLADEPRDSEQGEYLGAIVSSAQELTGTVAKLLSQQQQRLRGLEGQLVDVTQIALHSVQRAQLLVEKDNLWRKKLHKIVVDIPSEPAGVWADPAQLGQVFDNLLSNAIKFSPGGGTVFVRMGLGEHDFPQEDKELASGNLSVARRPAVFVSVQDNGVGIPPEEIANIWLAFYQVDASATRHFGGTGVGLALVKDIVEVHGGDIWVESQVRQGATFTFALPLYLATAQEKQKSAPAEQTTIHAIS